MIYEILIAFAIILPAVFLAFTGSSRLLDYAIVVIAFNRLIRRLVDYYIHGEFNPFSLISLTPLVVACLLLIPALARFHTLSNQARLVFTLLIAAIGYGFAVGFLFNGFGAVFSLGEWLSSLGALAFAATMPADERAADRWIRSAGWAAIGVAAYGWWQYYTIPEWDAFWVREVGFVGYLGNLRPTEMSVFSTMNSRGPCAAFLAWGVIPMILNPRWRNATGWIGVLLILSCILLTMTRTMFIVIAVIAVLTPLLSGGRGARSLLVLCVIMVLGFTQGISYIPGAERIQSRYDTFSNIQEDGSLQGRIGIYKSGIGAVVSNPIGYGLGSSGLAARVSQAAASIGDSGYLQIMFQFGWIGGACFFGALFQLWRCSSRRFRLGSEDAFVNTSRGVLLGCMVFLLVGDIFAGFSLFWVIFGRALSPETDPELVEEPTDGEDTPETIDSVESLYLR